MVRERDKGLCLPIYLQICPFGSHSSQIFSMKNYEKRTGCGVLIKNQHLIWVNDSCGYGKLNKMFKRYIIIIELYIFIFLCKLFKMIRNDK
jgi:hypothetical protein